MNFDKFIDRCVVEKGDQTTEITHQQFGKYVKRNLAIKEDDYDQFTKLYYNDILKHNKSHNIIERQLNSKQKDKGFNLFDFDLHFPPDYTTRQYTTKHIDTLIQFVLQQYVELFELDDDYKFPVVLLEKPAPRVVTRNSGTIVKDGFHLMFCVRMDPYILLHLRNKVIDYLKKEWDDLPVTNSFEDIVDKAIPDGANGWLAPNSKKEDEPTFYTITKAFYASFDNDTGSFDLNTLVSDPKNASELKLFYSQHYKSLFIRNKSVLEFELLTDYGAEIQNELENSRNNHSSSRSPTTGNNLAFGGDETWQIPLDAIRMIRNPDDLSTVLDGFLNNIPISKNMFKTIYEYIDSLPESYYGPGSYNKWIKVGLVLYNTSRYLHIIWLYFSAKSSSFDWSTDVDGLCDHWEKWNRDISSRGEKVSHASLMYWCKTENPEEYLKIRNRSIDHSIDQSFHGLSVQQLNANGKHKGSTDVDIAKILYLMYQGKFVSSSIKSNEWYTIEEHYWKKDDSGTSLRKAISSELREIYHNKRISKLQGAMQIKKDDGTVNQESDDYQLAMAQANFVGQIADRLGSSKDKDHVLREAKEQFYDSEFTRKLDQHRHLICFLNGVFDFNTQEFRPGRPDDYISKCTQWEYRPVDRVKDAETIKEIELYLHQLFPNQQVYDYMWNHLAAMLTGWSNKVQGLHYYIGCGSNGKSLFINFIELLFGDYAVSLDANFFTSSRTSRGNATPDLAKLPGARVSITLEPTEAGKPVVLTEGPMKQLTSGCDRIAYRGLYKDEDHFIPQAHAIICANDYLAVRSGDDGTWRRINVVPFESCFTTKPVNNDPDKPYQYKVDVKIQEKFRKWAPVMLGLLVEITCKQMGVVPMNDVIRKHSQAYRRREDHVATFIEDHFEACEVNVDQRLQKSVVQRLFVEWYIKEYGDKPGNKVQVVYDTMSKRFGELKKHPYPGWDGVRQLRLYADDPTTDMDDDDD